MNSDKKLSPEDAARKLQGMVSLGIPDTKFSAQATTTQAISAELPPETTETTEKAGKAEKEGNDETVPVLPSPARRKRREQPESYRDTYFRRVDFSDRQPLYITRTTHEKLMMMVNLIGGRKATISSFVENVVLQHLENHREEINRLFDEHYAKSRNEF